MATKKQLREERALERTVLQAESIANEIRKQDAAGAEGYSVICPDCGQLVPSDYQSFASKADADKYAREHCDCRKQGRIIALSPKTNEAADLEIMPREQLLGILFTPAPDNRPKLKSPSSLTQFGACRYCGQAQSAYGCRTEDEANEYATSRCKCSEAIAYQDKLEAAQKREEALNEVEDNLDDLFGSGTLDCGERNLCPEAIDLLKQAATLIYDHKIVSQSLKLTYAIAAKIGRTAKGNISIERKDATAQKVEV